MKLDAWQVYSDAMSEHQPRKVFALFSGGNDSKVLVHWARQLGRRLDAAVYIDTGTALPGVEQFVHEFCERYEVPLKVYRSGDAYLQMVRKHGVPGPGAHLFPYVLLKERRIDELVREHKEHRSDRIMLLTGVRRAESRQRMGNVAPCERDGAQVWVAPLIDWSNRDAEEYREHYDLPMSEATALMHRSGECNCGAYASPDEREMLRSLYPDWFEATIGRAEREAAYRGLHSRWGEPPPTQTGEPPAGRMCSDCRPLFCPQCGSGDYRITNGGYDDGFGSWRRCPDDFHEPGSMPSPRQEEDG